MQHHLLPVCSMILNIFDKTAYKPHAHLTCLRVIMVLLKICRSTHTLGNIRRFTGQAAKRWLLINGTLSITAGFRSYRLDRAFSIKFFPTFAIVDRFWPYRFLMPTPGKRKKKTLSIYLVKGFLCPRIFTVFVSHRRLERKRGVVSKRNGIYPFGRLLRSLR